MSSVKDIDCSQSPELITIPYAAAELEARITTISEFTRLILENYYLMSIYACGQINFLSSGSPPKTATSKFNKIYERGERKALD